MSGIGHNGGPSMEAGFGFRKVAWTKARAVAFAEPAAGDRAGARGAGQQRLGLPYKTYATIRATSGRDIVAFLFSGNALGLSPARSVPEAARAARLENLRGAVERLAAVYAPLQAPEAVIHATPGLDAAVAAPTILTPWGETRGAPARVRPGAGFAARWRRAGFGHGAGAGLVRGRGPGGQPQRRDVFHGPAIG
jgi:hypothetical protein